MCTRCVCVCVCCYGLHVRVVCLAWHHARGWFAAADGAMLRPRLACASHGPHDSTSPTTRGGWVQALKYERFQSPESLGSSVFGVQGVHQRLAPFVRAWHAAGRPKLYVASVDVRKCYDTMKQVRWGRGRWLWRHAHVEDSVTSTFAIGPGVYHRSAFFPWSYRYYPDSSMCCHGTHARRWQLPTARCDRASIARCACHTSSASSPPWLPTSPSSTTTRWVRCCV